MQRHAKFQGRLGGRSDDDNVLLFPVACMHVGVWITYSLYSQDADCDSRESVSDATLLICRVYYSSIVGFVSNAEVLYSIVQSFVFTIGFVSYQLTGQQLYDHIRSVAQLVCL